MTEADDNEAQFLQDCLKFRKELEAGKVHTAQEILEQRDRELRKKGVCIPQYGRE